MMNDCNEFEELIDLAATEELHGSDRWRLEAHLTGCVACRTQLAETRWIARLLRQEFAEEQFVAPHRPMKTFVRPALALAAAASLLLGAGWSLSGGWRREQQVAKHEAPSHLAKGRSFAERKTTFGGADTIAAPDARLTEPDTDAELVALTAAIDREANAAELAASAEVLADVPGDYAADSWRLLARTFPETKAGRAAALRPEGSRQ